MSWDPEDRAKHIAYILEQNERCQMCGTAGWEWSENKFAYTPVEDFCTGCYNKSVFADTESRSMPGTTVKLIPTTPELTARMAIAAKKRATLRTDD